MSMGTQHSDQKEARLWAVAVLLSLGIGILGAWLYDWQKGWSIAIGATLVTPASLLFVTAVLWLLEHKLASLPKGAKLFKLRMWLIRKVARARHGMVRGFRNRAEMRRLFHPAELFKNCSKILVKGISLNDFVDEEVRSDVKAAIEANDNPDREFSFYVLDTRHFMNADFLTIREIDECKQGLLVEEVWATKFTLHEIKKKPRLADRVKIYSYLTYPTESLAVFDKLLMIGPYRFKIDGPASPWIVADAISKQFSPFVDTFEPIESQGRVRLINRLVCLVGNLTVDNLAWEGHTSSNRSGGSVFYAGLALAKLNCDVVVVGNGDDKGIELLRRAGICVLWMKKVNETNTMKFVNCYTGNVRSQRATSGARVGGPQHGLMQHIQAFDAIMYLPVLEEINCMDFRGFKDISSVIDAQGFVRRAQSADSFAEVTMESPRYSPLRVLRNGSSIWRGDLAEGKAWTGKQYPRDISLALLQEGAGEVIITNGPSGLWGCDGKRFYELTNLGKVDKDPTGAGDVFDACYLFALLDGISATTERLKFAAAASYLMVAADWNDHDPLAKFPSLMQIKEQMEQIPDPEVSNF